MSDYIKKVRTSDGDKQIDYTALANLPTVNGQELIGNIEVSANGNDLYYGTEKPTDESHPIWINPDGETNDDVYQAISELQSGLNNKAENNHEHEQYILNTNIANNLTTTESGYVADARTVAALSTDYIVAESENKYANSGWVWRKWSSGIAECWCNQTCGNAAVTTAWGSLYETSGSFSTPDFPFEFVEVPYVHVTYFSADAGTAYAAFIMQPHPSYTNPGTFDFMRPSSYTIGHPKVKIYAIGAWK